MDEEPERSIRYDRILQVRAPALLSSAIETAAHRRGCKCSEYIRQAILAVLRTDGLDPYCSKAG